jgi:hypothetical protein
VRGSRRSSASRASRPRSPGTSCSPRGGGSSSRSPAPPPCSSSRTCSGPTTACSSSSSTWSTGLSGCRCWSSASPGRSCTSGIRPGEAAGAARCRSACRRCRAGDLDAALGAPRAGHALPGGPRRVARARRREPALCGGVRADAPGRGRGPGHRSLRHAADAAAADRLAPGLTPARGEGGPAGRRRRREGVLDGRDRLDVGPARRGGRASAGRGRPSRVRTTGPWLERRWAAVRVPHARPGRRVRTDPRATRADRHVAAAAWIREVAGDRVSDLAEVPAHHYGRRSSWPGRVGSIGPSSSASPATRS